jgi:hypothetical protein
VQATDFFERAGAIADEIQQTGAALVGLQEAALWRTQFPGDSFLPGGGVPAIHVEYAFAAAPPGGDGFSCCQAEDLRNTASLLDERVDLVLLKGALTAKQVVVVGDESADRTESGLWPSDHAGVAATIRLENPKFFALH